MTADKRGFSAPSVSTEAVESRSDFCDICNFAMLSHSATIVDDTDYIIRGCIMFL